MNIFKSMAKVFTASGKSADGVKRSGFSAAKKDRLTFDWITSNLTMDSELRRSLKTMRSRSRELERNDDYVRNFLSQTVTNVVGPHGFVLQMQIKNADGSPDKFANDLIEESWKKWCKKGICTMDGRQSWQDVQRLFIRSVARDGEVIARIIKGRSVDNDNSFAIQLLEADHLDEEDFRKLSNKNKVKMGVEVNSWNRPEFYHLWNDHPGDDQHLNYRHDKIRVAAADCLHVFIADRPGQTRGLPWLVSAMTRLHMLGGYEEAELVASRVAASKMGFFENEESTIAPIADQKAPDGSMVMDAEPGTFQDLPIGKKFKAWDPQHPNGAFNAFIKAMLRGVGASVGLFYPTLSGDLEGVNFSSIRQGVLSEREMWRVLQDWMVQSFIRPIFEAWLEMSLTTGAIALPLAKYEKFNKPKWQPRGWQWVDPLKDVNANIAALDAGLTTRSQILSEKGRSFEDVLEELKREQQQMKEAGIIPGLSFAPDPGEKTDE